VKYFLVFLLLIIGPVVMSAANYLMGERRGNWQTADRSSAGILPDASEHPDALIRVYAARTVRWRGIFAVHSWIIVKERGAAHYTRLTTRPGASPFEWMDLRRMDVGSVLSRKRL
jgi:hypothetical protein